MTIRERASMKMKNSISAWNDIIHIRHTYLTQTIISSLTLEEIDRPAPLILEDGWFVKLKYLPVTGASQGLIITVYHQSEREKMSDIVILNLLSVIISERVHDRLFFLKEVVVSELKSFL